MENAGDGAEWRIGFMKAAKTVEVAEQFVGSVDEMDYHLCWLGSLDEVPAALISETLPDRAQRPQTLVIAKSCVIRNYASAPAPQKIFIDLFLMP